jgi:hypothetical protein
VTAGYPSCALTSDRASSSVVKGDHVASGSCVFPGVEHLDAYLLQATVRAVPDALEGGYLVSLGHPQLPLDAPDGICGVHGLTLPSLAVCVPVSLPLPALLHRRPAPVLCAKGSLRLTECLHTSSLAYSVGADGTRR